MKIGTCWLHICNDFLVKIEFTTIKLIKYTSDSTYTMDHILGLKQQIIKKYKFVCTHYDSNFYLDDMDMDYKIAL